MTIHDVNFATDMADTPFKHDHRMLVDPDGNGWTSVAKVSESGDTHGHAIKNWAIQSADGHTHDSPQGRLMRQGSKSPTALRNKVKQKPVDLT